jgi:putative phosphoesterase
VENNGPPLPPFSLIQYNFNQKIGTADNKEIMRIGLISDTHIAWENKRLSPQVTAAIKGVDLILHAGDIYTHRVLDELESIAPVLAALGDDDYPGPDPRVKEKHILVLEGLTLWLVHEKPFNLVSPEDQANLNSADGEKREKPDIVVFGHEHRVIIERISGVLYVNSGSPTLLNYKQGPGTVGILELNAGIADVRIIQL